MGNHDRRHSMKMRRREAQAKKKARAKAVKQKAIEAKTPAKKKLHPALGAGFQPGVVASLRRGVSG